MTTLDRFLPTGLRPFRDRGRSALAAETSDVERVQRAGALFFGCATVALVVLSIPVMLAKWELTAPWWPPVSAFLVVVPPILLVIAALRRKTGWLRPLAAVNAIAYPLAVALWLPAATGVVPAEASRWTLWMLQFPMVPSLLLVVARCPRWAVASFVLTVVPAYVVNQLAITGFEDFLPQSSMLLTLAMSVLFLVITMVTVRTAELLDATRAEAITAGAASAAAVAREAERTRFAALIHDKVIATLLAVEAGRTDPRLVRQADIALAELDQLDSPSPEPRTCPGIVDDAALGDRIRTRAATVGGGVRLRVSVRNPAAGGSDRERAVYPELVADTICAAMDEAIRNVSRHAGPRALCVVTVDMTDSGIRVLIVDDGDGFDPASVSPERFGLRDGIIGRMAALPGGVATVTSTRSEGTTITLIWTDEDR